MAWIKARKFPGVRCSTLKTVCNSLLCLMIMPGRICVAGIAIREKLLHLSLDRRAFFLFRRWNESRLTTGLLNRRYPTGKSLLAGLKALAPITDCNATPRGRICSTLHALPAPPRSTCQRCGRRSGRSGERSFSQSLPGCRKVAIECRPVERHWLALAERRSPPRSVEIAPQRDAHRCKSKGQSLQRALRQWVQPVWTPAREAGRAARLRR